MEDTMKEFVAFSRKLLRELQNLKKVLESNDIETAKRLVDELIEDTQRDIEA